VDGKKLWQAGAFNQTYFNFIPVALDGHVYSGATGFGTTSYGLDEDTGAVNHIYFSNSFAGGNATIGGGNIFFPEVCNLPAYNLRSNSLAWAYSVFGCDGASNSLSAYYRGFLYSPRIRFGGRGLVFNASNGAVRGVLQDDQRPAFYGRTLYTMVYGPHVSNFVRLDAYDIPTGRLKWKFTPY